MNCDKCNDSKTIMRFTSTEVILEITLNTINYFRIPTILLIDDPWTMFTILAGNFPEALAMVSL